MSKKGIKIIGIQNNKYKEFYKRLDDALKGLNLSLELKEENDINKIIAIRILYACLHWLSTENWHYK